jgi:protein involved in polysaccharide export with SLBB domain
MFRKTNRFILLALLLFPGFVSGQEVLREVNYGVRAGDELTIQVFTSAGAQLDEISGVRIVDPSGQIYLPYVGTLKVEGMSAPDIRNRLEREYSALYANPVVDVASRIKVNVTGAVRAPSHYLLDPSSTIIDALATAGGVASEVDLGQYAASDPEQSRFVRNGELFVLDLRPNTGDPRVFSLPVQSGDWIHIPIAARSRTRERVQFWSQVVGLVSGTALMIYLVTGGN